MRREKREALRDRDLGYLDGVTTVEVILVLVILLAIVVIFREQLMGIVNNIFSHINESVNGLY